jgi:aspartate-semialdehyde dehydrogenase
MASKVNVAVVGATGAVGREMLNVLRERQFPVAEIKALASAKSAGEEIEWGEASILVEELTRDSFEGVDIALFSAGGAISAEYGEIARDAGAVVIDNSSHFRMFPEVPLIVPEVNASTLKSYLAELPSGRGCIIANPNCSTIQLVVALKPIHDAVGLKRVVVSTYQSVSGAGKKGMDELWEQSLAIFNQKEIVAEKFAHQIAFNCLPHIDSFLENGYTKEEVKVVNESRKILGIPNLKITCTAVRIPVFSCHSESVNIETEKKITVKECQKLLSQSPGVIVLDEPESKQYPLAINLAGTDATYVGRIREDESVDNGLNMWVVADNLRKGAALNAVQIAEVVVAKN